MVQFPAVAIVTTRRAKGMRCSSSKSENNIGFIQEEGNSAAAYLVKLNRIRGV